ncbi:hypothetical protein BS78_K236000 [Paspalum vaginatum]|uniref:Uncharacterized protein n=1 Tax=Paspalum vaginatum TaxID=158149 RepID=A0A9W8CC02_9POAL|nr:hypothetical protein BS78_K236000 [Paspalum vaginatum]
MRCGSSLTPPPTNKGAQGLSFVVCEGEHIHALIIAGLEMRRSCCLRRKHGLQFKFKWTSKCERTSR